MQTSYLLPFFEKLKYEEYFCNAIQRVQIRDTEDDAGVNTSNYGNKYIVQANMFAFELATDVLLTMANNILEKINGFTYHPMRSIQNGLPFMEVGDTIEYQVSSAGYGVDTFLILSRTLSGVQFCRDTYESRGTQNQSEYISDLQAEVEVLKRTTTEIRNLSTKIVDYILPTNIEESDIASGSNSNVIEFEFYNSAENETTSLYASVNFVISTDADLLTETYGDCTLTVTYIKDGTNVEVQTHTFGDGSYMLMLNYLLQNLSKGNHTFKIKFALSGGSLSSLQVISAYILAASVVEEGNYEEDYDVETDQDFVDYMYEEGDAIVGEYLDLTVPSDGGKGNFDGTKFCGEWLSAFIRPMEYFALYKAKVSYPAPAITEDSPLWTTYDYQNQLLPQYLDNRVVANSGKHINFWTATISPPNPALMQDLVAVKMWGAYIGSDIAWKVASNEPTHGFVSFYYDHIGTDISVCDPTDEYFNGYSSQGWDSRFGSHNSLEPTFILVYNVTVFKQYLSNMENEELGHFIANHHFALCECNVSKDKR